MSRSGGWERLDWDYQTRFWARVELESFQQTHEMIPRRLVTPSEFREALYGGQAPTAGLILARALAIGQQRS